MKKYSIGNGKSETKLQHLLSLPNKSKKSNQNKFNNAKK